MKKHKYLIFIFIILLAFINACSELMPDKDNTYDLNDVKSVVTYAEGLLINAYRNIPVVHNNFNLSYASDDAVNNVPTSSVKSVVEGGWTSSSNPFDTWNTAYESIMYINTFMDQMDDIDWYWKNQQTSTLFARKLRGEAFALRTWNYFNLLQAHSGIGKNGELLGVPIVDHVLATANPSDYQIPRASFDDLVKFIITDCDSAISILPVRWTDSGNGNVDIAVGARNTNRINGSVARLIKAKTLLYAASPAYSDGTYTYQMAAQAAADLLGNNNGLTNITFANNQYIEFYSNPNVPNAGDLSPEVLWYSTRVNSSLNWETSNYPPSLYGQGLTNPTQDLVNAFPMADGTPTPDAKINSSDPYSGRDPRLAKYILFNGAQFVIGAQTITINTKDGTTDALGSSNIYATKTGYYLKKFMDVADVNLDPIVNSGGLHYYTYARYTDALLIFAEAANEAGGPDALIGGYSSRQVINALRTRAGITSTVYANGLDQTQMRDLIRNERRIEMCFEEQRFWDLRRWELTTLMKTSVSGVNVSADGTTYNYHTVENRNFSDYQIYGPVPYNETLKYKLIQNMGWQ
ncbi:MAG TPA: RagB/SusD family nutrient uptake outer membrane protein [Bacteroidales bacterium]|nr:RagB/SusD family nutrient uptake outer membrane protein [Bacteroidales bacterium]